MIDRFSNETFSKNIQYQLHCDVITITTSLHVSRLDSCGEQEGDQVVGQEPMQDEAEASAIGCYNEGGFWERILNNPDCEWSVEAETIAAEYNSNTSKKVDAIKEVNQEEILTMMRTASKQKERMAVIDTRFVAMSPITKDQAKQVGIPKQQFEKEIRSTKHKGANED
ncbi:unnamed protein product [Nippostrongylus brasiliensis]|uniref:Remorin_C domain-containing protein n=1 Tax=Nippostrongylus brasiliensis TaxID=27835 RepID=A0A0N4Y1T6_NIPBR|nr:unnamed protein product [Nippostrongylus brasiliensis]